MIQMKTKQDWINIYVAFIIGLTGIIRAWYMTANSITQDESTMILFSRGILERGYPFLRQVHNEFLISTYEIVPYPIALGTLLLGDNEAGVRLPAVIFSMLTAYLLYCYGKRLFCQKTALLAVTLYSVLPWAIYWGSNAFYPAQVQFFALLCIMAVHTLLTAGVVTAKDYYKIPVFFTCMYLSWEGSGILLPVFFITALLLNWGNWRWLASRHAWVTGILIIVIIEFQLTYRTVLRMPFTVLGSSRSNVSSLSLSLLKPDFDPFFYFRELFAETHLLIFLLFALGFLYLKRDWNLRFIYAIILLSLVVLTCFLGYYALRYVYFLLPWLLLAVAAVTVRLIDGLGQTPAKTRTLFVLTAMLLITLGSPWGLKPTGIDEDLTVNRPFELRPDLGGFSFRSVNLALRQNYRRGDIVVVQSPFPTQAYLGVAGDYFLQPQTVAPVAFERASLPYYTDKWIGNPVLTNTKELETVMQKNARVWIVATPYGPSKQSFGEEMTKYVAEHFCVVADTIDGRLMLWENPSAISKERSCS